MLVFRFAIAAFILATTVQCTSKKDSIEEPVPVEEAPIVQYDTFLYLSNSNANTIEIFKVTETDGEPSFNKIDTYTGASFSAQMKTNSSASQLFVGYPADTTQQVFAIAPETGALSLLATKTLSAGFSALALSLDEAILFIKENTLLRSYGIDTDSSLIQIDAESPAGSILVHHPKLNVLYTLVPFGAGEISSTSYDGLGSQFQGTTITTGGTSASSMAIDSQGRILVVSHDGGPLETYTINSAGALSLGTSTNLSASQVATHPTLNVLYVVDNNNSVIRSYSVNINSGALTEFGNSISFSGQAAPLSIEPGGNFLIVPDNNASSFSVFKIDSETGGLSAATTVSVSSEANPKFSTFVRMIKE